MRLTKISYGRTYPLGNYASERIDMESTIDDSESITFVVGALKAYCDAEHQKNNPHLYQEQTPIHNDVTNWANPPEKDNFHYRYNPNGSVTISDQPLSKPEEKISEEQSIENIITDIEKCENESQLLEYKYVSAKNIRTVGAYNKRKKQLNIQ